MKGFATTAAAMCCLWLAACSGGPVRRVSPPAVNIQQLTVHADGSWAVDLRIENFSSIAMRFDGIGLAMTVGGQFAGTLAARPALAIGPESADVVTLPIMPASATKIVIADTLARGGSVDYKLEGTLDAAPADRGGVRPYEVKRNNALSPVPGLPGVMR